MNAVVCVDEPLSRRTAWRTGGRCGVFVVPRDEEALSAVTAECRSAGWGWSILGAGTRTVYRDGETRGAVIRLGAGFAGVAALDERRWRVGAAAAMPAVLGRLAAAGLSGLEDLGAVAGSVGASVALDSGWEEVVESAEVFHRGRFQPATYDEIRGGKRIIGAVTVRLSLDRPDVVRRRLERAVGAPRPASSWYAAPRRENLRSVLRSVHLPSVRLRGVAIPESAPEMLVNLGGGTASDLALLHRSALERVRQSRGLDLESRVLWIGG